jgi:hypothetical protein
MNTPTREQRKFHRRVQSAMARAYAPGREERMAAAQAKRDRKAKKRARCAGHRGRRDERPRTPGAPPMAMNEKPARTRKAETYRGYRRNTTGKFEQARMYRRARWKALRLGQRLAERRAAA